MTTKGKGQLYLGYRPSQERVKEEIKALTDNGYKNVKVRPLTESSYIDFEIDTDIE